MGYKDFVKLGWVVSVLIGLSACGAGGSTKSAAGNISGKSTPQVTNQATAARSNQSLSAKQQAQINQSINKIRANPQTSSFAITSSYPYVLTGNLSQPEIEHWKSRIQRTQAAIKSMYFKHEPREVVQIWLFKDSASYFKYNQSLWSASPGTSYGYYLPDQKRMMMNIATGGGTLTHELVHPYIEANFPRSPLWFNEGLASLYEQSTYKNGKVFGMTNWRLAGLKTVINAGAMPSLEQMIQTNRAQFLGPNRTVYYAQARYLMYYLQSKGKLETYYHQFVANAPADPSGMKTLLRVAGFQSIERLESDWLRFISKLRY